MKFVCPLVLLSASVAGNIATSLLPIVDLGYVRQQATEYNASTGLYIYRNVRYARPPVGEFRFRKPQPPLQEPAGTVSNGSQYRTTVCPQAMNPIAATKGFSEDCLVNGISFLTGSFY